MFPCQNNEFIYTSVIFLPENVQGALRRKCSYPTSYLIYIVISAKTSRDTGYSPQKCVSQTENPPLLAKSATTQGILHKSVYREHAPHHYTQNMQRHRVLAAKGCIANRKTAITGKILQRHRFFGSKECVADSVGSKQCIA